MRLLRENRFQIIGLIAGIFLGYLIIHPFSMMMSAMMHLPQEGNLHLGWHNWLGAQTLKTFTPVMLPMAVAFSVLGGVIGLLAGALIAKRESLHQAELVKAKKKIALETMRNLLVTLSHYLLNANMIIGGKVRHCKKLVLDGDLLASLDVIEEEGRKIDSVIKALRELNEIKTVDYTSDGQILIIDITRELDEQLAQEGQTSTP
jgi:signal transduction histidine kinase